VMSLTRQDTQVDLDAVEMKLTDEGMTGHCDVTTLHVVKTPVGNTVGTGTLFLNLLSDRQPCMCLQWVSIVVSS
jgi:hypothetical protein